MKRIVITGSISTGKSTVSNYLKALGYPLLDADTIARQVVAPHSQGLSELVKMFGDEILDSDGKLSREKLGEKIFTNSESKKQVNELLHPLIMAKMNQEIIKLQKEGESVVFLDIPLFYEMENPPKVDAVWLVYVPVAIQLKRLMKRNKIDEDTAKNLISNQLSIDEKAEWADAVIKNEGELEDTYQQVDKLLKKL